MSIASRAVTVAVLLSLSELAELLGTSLRTVQRMNATGALPAPIRIGARPRWRRDEIDAWIAAGCPERTSWNERR